MNNYDEVRLRNAARRRDTIAIKKIVKRNPYVTFSSVQDIIQSETPCIRKLDSIIVDELEIVDMYGTPLARHRTTY
jgi:hypothetical protein